MFTTFRTDASFTEQQPDPYLGLLASANLHSDERYAECGYALNHSTTLGQVCEVPNDIV